MRRRIIRQGNNSFTLTLPVQWIRDQNLKEGDEVDITQDETRLVVAQETASKKKSIELSLDQEYPKNIKFLLSSLYRHGYDEIKLHVQKPEVLRIVERIVEEQFFEMEVLEKKGNTCVIGMVSVPSIDSYESLLRKMFFIIQESMDIIIRSVNQKSRKELKDIELLTLKYRRYDNFCRRHVFTKASRSVAFDSSVMFFDLIFLQTDLQKLAMRLKPSSPVDLALFQKLRALYVRVYQAFLKKEFAGLYDANAHINALLKQRWARKPKGDFLFTHYCLLLLRVLYGMVVPMMGLQLELPGS